MTDEHTELEMARSVLVALGTDPDYLDWNVGWIDSGLHLNEAQTAYWRSLLSGDKPSVRIDVDTMEVVIGTERHPLSMFITEEEIETIGAEARD